MPNTIAGSTLTVEIARGANPAADPSTYTWTDISNYVRADGVSIRRGRSDYAMHTEPMTLSFTVLNSDGRFSPGNRAGAYWPDMRKSIPVRVTMDGSVRFVGFVDSLPLSWPSQVTTVAWVTVTASGRWRRVARNPQSTDGSLQRSTMAANPAVYWPLEDGPGTASAYPIAGSSVLVARTGNVTWQGADGAAGFGGKTVLLGQAELGGDLPGNFNLGALSLWIDMPEGNPLGDYAGVILNVARFTNAFTQLVLTAGSTSAGQSTITCTLFTDAVVGPAWEWTTTGVFEGWTNLQFKITEITPGVAYDPTFLVNNQATTQTHSNGGLGFLEMVQPLNIALYGPTGAYPDVTQVGFGHLAMFPVIAGAVPNQYQAGIAYDQEAASARYVRLAAELGIATTGTPAAATVLGPQTTAPSLGLLQETADAEVGFLYETTTGYTALQPRADRYNPAAFMALDIAQGHVTGGFQPTFDDQSLVNDVTVSRPAGSSYRYINTASVAAYGTYHQDVTVNLGLDADLPAYASWLASISADPNQPRIAGLVLNMLTIGSTLKAAWLGGEPLGKLLTVANPPSQMASDTLGFFIEGYTETIAVDRYDVALNLSPGSPFTNVFVLEGSGDSGRLGMDGQTVAANASAGATSLSLASPGSTLFITTALHAGSFPIDLRIDGRKVTATAASGTSSPQTLTVTALPAAVTAGMVVELWSPAYLAL